MGVAVGTRRVVTLYGSTRFRAAWLEWSARLTLEGNIVLSLGWFNPFRRIEPSPEQKALLGELHRRKIDLADEVFVLDVGGYVGDSTRREIDYALKTRKQVRYLSQECPGWTEQECELVPEAARVENWVEEGAGVTRGEAIAAGTEKIREELGLIRKAGSQTEALPILVGSSRGAEQLRQVMQPGLLRSIIVSMVHSKNSRLSAETVEKVLDEFLRVLFELPKPYGDPGPQVAPDASGSPKGTV